MSDEGHDALDTTQAMHAAAAAEVNVSPRDRVQVSTMPRRSEGE